MRKKSHGASRPLERSISENAYQYLGNSKIQHSLRIEEAERLKEKEKENKSL